MDEYEKKVRELAEEYRSLHHGIKTRLSRLSQELLSCPSTRKPSLLEDLTKVYQNAARTEPGSYSDRILRKQIADLSQQLDEETMPKGETILKGEAGD